MNLRVAPAKLASLFALLSCVFVPGAYAGPCDVELPRIGYYSFAVRSISGAWVHRRSMEVPTGRDSMVKQRIVVDFVSVVESTSLTGRVEEVAARINGLYQSDARLFENAKSDLRRKIAPLLAPGQEFEPRSYRFAAVAPGAGYEFVGRDTITQNGQYIKHALYARQSVEETRVSGIETVEVTTDLRVEAQGMVTGGKLLVQVAEISARVRPLPGTAMAAVKAVTLRKLQTEASKEALSLRERMSRFYPLSETELRALCGPPNGGETGKPLTFEFLGQSQELLVQVAAQYKTTLDGELGGPGR